MSLTAIRAALETRLDTISPSIASAYENAKYTPVSGTPYQQVHLLLATPDNPVMGTGFREQGFMQVTLLYPLLKGPGDAQARADLIRTTFPKGLSLTNSGVVVNIDKTPVIGNGTVDGDRWRVPVKIPFHSNMM